MLNFGFRSIYLCCVLKLSSHFSTHFIHHIQVNGSGSEGGILYRSHTRHKVAVQSVGLSNWKSC